MGVGGGGSHPGGPTLGLMWGCPALGPAVRPASLYPHSGAGSAASCLQAGGTAECPGEELACPPGHRSTDPGEGPPPPGTPGLVLRSWGPSAGWPRQQ